MDTTELTVKLTELKPGPYQSRRVFDYGELQELAESIRENGVINPPLVAKAGYGYAILAGERRWRASCALAMVQSRTIPDLAAAVVLAATAQQMPGLGGERIAVRLAQGDDAELHAAAVIDNHQRANLNPVEEASDFQAFRERHGLTVYETAKRLGRSDGYVRNRLRLLELEPEVQALVAVGQLAKDTLVVDALLSLPDGATQVKLARRFTERRSSIKAIVAGCRRVVELIDLARQEQPPTPTVAVAAAKVTTAPAQTDAPVIDPGPALCLCDDCREQIARLAEELCGQCAARGLSAKCLTCPGVIEFVERLVRAAQ